MSDAKTVSDDAVTELREAAAAYRDAVDAIDKHGRDRLEELADAYSDAYALLATYEDKATDTGIEEFVNFAQFEGQFANLVDGLDDELPARDTFEAAREAVDKRRLSEDDFERAREKLSPASDLIELLDEHEAARDRLTTAVRRARERREELREEIAERERVLELGDADLDAPIEELRDPVERYDDAVEDAFEELLADAPARETFAVIDRASAFPLVALPPPPEDLREFVEETPAGEESITTLLEYADYSPSKLSHYVEDAGALKRNVATQRTYLVGLDATPLTVGWPPPPADRVPWLTRELRAVAGGFVEEDALAALRELEAAARDRERYERLRTAAIADEQLSAEDRDAIEDGRIEREIERRRATIEAIDEALDGAPDL